MKLVKSSLLVKLVILILVVYAVARDKLGMVDEGDIVFYDVGE